MSFLGGGGGGPFCASFFFGGWAEVPPPRLWFLGGGGGGPCSASHFFATVTRFCHFEKVSLARPLIFGDSFRFLALVVLFRVIFDDSLRFWQFFGSCRFGNLQLNHYIFGNRVKFLAFFVMFRIIFDDSFKCFDVSVVDNIHVVTLLGLALNIFGNNFMFCSFCFEAMLVRSGCKIKGN